MSTPDWAVRALATAPATGTTDVAGTPVAWRSWGQDGASPVVLVHGGGAHARWWDHLAPVLAAAGRRCVGVDLAGHGDSGHRPPYDPDGWVREVLAVADDLGLDRPALVGHSMGGFVVLRAAALAGPSRVGPVVVVDSPLLEPDAAATGVMAGRERGRPTRYPTRRAALERFRLIPDQPTPLRWTVDHVAETSLVEAEDGWRWKFDPPFLDVFSPRDPRWTESMRAVAVPLDVVVGEHSFVNEPGVLDHARATLPASTGWHEVPGAWHHVLLDRPRELVDLLDALLAARGR